MRVPGSVQRLAALAAVAAGGGFFAASVDGVAEVGASLAPPTVHAVRVVDDCPAHQRHVHEREL